MVREYVRRGWTAARGLREGHGLVMAIGLLMLRVLARLSGGTVLACMHKPVGPAAPSTGRLLSRREIERASADAGLELRPEFVASAQHSQCYGVVVDEHVRSYAWTTSERVGAVPGTMVRMSPAAAYVYKAFTAGSFRRRGLLRECLKAIEEGAARDGREEVTALVEVHNRNSLRAFRNAGFDRCGFVFLLKRPWIARRVGCSCARPCIWSREAKASRSPSARQLTHSSLIP
jgi:hypothetical protein